MPPALLPPIVGGSRRTSSATDRPVFPWARKSPGPLAPASIRFAANARVPVQMFVRCVVSAEYPAPGFSPWSSATPRDFPEHRGISTPPARGRRRLEPRLLPRPGCALRKYALERRPCGPLRAGINARRLPLHVHFLYGPHFHHAAPFKNWEP